MKFRWEIKLSIVLILLTAAVYAVKIAVIGDDGSSNTLTYIFNALGFLPLNVLFVTLIINGLLSVREKRERSEKMKMVLGAFFSEFGSTLLRTFVACDTNPNKIRGVMNVSKSWKRADFAKAAKEIDEICPVMNPDASDLIKIRDILSKNHDFLLRAVENPAFLEENRITKLMQELFHLDEELRSRGDIDALPVSDISHLAGDVNRVYCTLSAVWLSHMEYLSENYQYLLSLALRRSPFMEEDDVVVR
ncbi:MAG: hypothetical protein Q4Q53_02385 [Methanocorpusculum sp.]|nr:hypothetical protein [Methanocorpusculum sp.]